MPNSKVVELSKETYWMWREIQKAFGTAYSEDKMKIRGFGLEEDNQLYYIRWPCTQIMLAANRLYNNYFLSGWISLIDSSTVVIITDPKDSYIQMELEKLVDVIRKQRIVNW